MKNANALTATAEYREYAIALIKERAGEAIQLQSLIDANVDKYPNRNTASIRAALWNLHATSDEVVKVGRGKFAYKNAETELTSETSSSDESVAEQLVSSILECYDKYLKRVSMANLTADDFQDLAIVKRAIEELKNSVRKKNSESRS